MKTPRLSFDIFAINYLSPSKRKYPYWRQWMKIAVSQIQRLNLMFNSYLDGDESVYFNILTTYNLDDSVIYNYKTYKSLSDNNTGNVPDITSLFWVETKPSFIGTFERAQFCVNKLIFEYALNKYFKKEIIIAGLTGFKQPNDPVNPTPSDIYISNVAPVYTSFVVYSDETLSSPVYTDNSNNFVFTTETIIGSTTFTFSINIPTSVYSNINSDSSIAEKIVRNFADKYVPEGIEYIITTY